MVDSSSLEEQGSAARLTLLALRKASVGSEKSVTPEWYQILPSLVPINETQVIETISHFTKPVLGVGFWMGSGMVLGFWPIPDESLQLLSVRLSIVDFLRGPPNGVAPSSVLLEDSIGTMMQVEINELDAWLKRFYLPYVRMGIEDVIGDASIPGISYRLTINAPSHSRIEIRVQE
jgi:hypothetical protein